MQLINDHGLLTEAEFAEGVNVTTRTAMRWRDLGTGPPSIKLGNTVYYRRAAIDLWILELETSGCAHEWIDVRNAAVESGMWCPKCNSIKPSEP